MATPHVTGAIALYLQANPGASPSAVTQALTSNATLNHVTSAGIRLAEPAPVFDLRRRHRHRRLRRRRRRRRHRRHRLRRRPSCS